jgi:hypothetical protein
VSLPNPFHHGLGNIFVYTIDTELIAPDLVFNAGLQLTRGTEKFTHVNQ